MLCGHRSQKTHAARRKVNNMKLLSFSVGCVAAQFVAAHVFLNVMGFSGVLFFFSMAIVAHLIIELAVKTSLQRDSGFLVFILCHFIGEAYLFALAVLGAISLAFPVYLFMFEVGQYIMLFLTALALASSSLTPILNNMGTTGDGMRHCISDLYSAAMRLPIHKVRV